MQTKYTIFERDDNGQVTPVGEVLGTLNFHEQVWEMHTQTEVIPGTLEGHPLSAHVFKDEDGREYRVT